MRQETEPTEIPFQSSPVSSSHPHLMPRVFTGPGPPQSSMIENGGQEPGPGPLESSMVGNGAQKPMLIVSHHFQPWSFLEILRNLPLQIENLTWRDLAFP